MKTLNLKPALLFYSGLAFTIGYFISILISDNFNANAYLAGLIGNIIGFLIIAWWLE